MTGPGIRVDGPQKEVSGGYLLPPFPMLSGHGQSSPLVSHSASSAMGFGEGSSPNPPVKPVLDGGSPFNTDIEMRDATGYKTPQGHHTRVVTGPRQQWNLPTPTTPPQDMEEIQHNANITSAKWQQKTAKRSLESSPE